MWRRQALASLGQWSLFSTVFQTGSAQRVSEKKLKIMIKSAWGSDDPTRASFPFVHGLALADAGHEVRIFLTGEATYLMRKTTADQIFPVGWPATFRDPREGAFQTYPCLFLRGMFPGPWGHGSRPGDVGCEIRQP